MRICVVYDCLFPYTVGGGERWYRALAQRLAADGHQVTYLTLRQWDRGERGEIPGVRVVACGPRMELYRGEGQRRILPPLVFGAGVLRHLLRHGRRYDVVHTCSFPYFSLLAAGLLRRPARYGIVVDWFELWSREYWREYLGRVGGRIGWTVQALCARVPQRAFCLARMTAERLRAQRVRGEVTVLRGAYTGPLQARTPLPAEPLVVFAGRHIPEKDPLALVAAMARLRSTAPEIGARILGDGPERPRVLAAIADQDLSGHVEAPGFVALEQVEHDLARALCMVLPSRREGYGLVVVEASASGVPSVVVDHPDNAAVELVEDGVNGVVVPTAAPADIEAGILRVREAGAALRLSTADWFAANAESLSIDASLERVVAAYRRRA